jgi:hypothetical protein
MSNNIRYIECSEELIKNNLIEQPEIIHNKYKIEINDNLIKVKEYGTINLYFKYKENKKYQKIISKENETIYCPSFTRYRFLGIIP